MQKKRFLEAVYLSETPPRRAYYSALPAVRWLAAEGRRLTFSADVAFFAGENGTGKSTLLEAIAVAAGFNAEGGTRNFHFSTAATHSGLHEQLNLVRGRRPRDGFFRVRSTRCRCFSRLRKQRENFRLNLIHFVY